MPANDFIGWQAYFNIYPFTQDREDARFALLAQIITNMSGKTLKNPMKLSAFLPTYIETHKPITDPLQRNDYKAFKQKLQDIKR
jgi:hypothetical protein